MTELMPIASPKIQSTTVRPMVTHDHELVLAQRASFSSFFAASTGASGVF